MIDPAEKTFRRRFDAITVLLVESLGAFPGIQDEVPSAGFLGAFLQRTQKHASKPSTLSGRVDRHEPDLRLGRAVQMQTADGKCLAVRRAYHQMNAFIFTVITLRAPRLVPSRAEHAPAEIEIAFEIPIIFRRNERRIRQRIGRNFIRIVHTVKMRTAENFANVNLRQRGGGDQ